MHVNAFTPDQPMREGVAVRGASALTGLAYRYVLALLYSFALCYAYEVLSQWWAYFGFTYKLVDRELLVVACAVAALPSIFLKARPTNFAQAAAWYLYALVFLPCLLVPVMQFSSTGERLAQVYLGTLVACIVFLAMVRPDVTRWTRPVLAPRFFWGALFAMWISLMLLVVGVFGGSLQFVGSEDIYTQRFAGAETASNPIVRYAIALLASGINPFLIAAGLYTRRYWISAVGVGGQIILFGTLAAKSVLLSPFFILGAFLMFDRESRMRGNLLLAGLIAVFVVTFPLLAVYNPVGGAIHELTTLLYLRTLLISGATYGVYEQFFSLFPLTYFSNNNVISLFVEYPFGPLSVGQAVQQFIIPSSSVELGELNANFLATDGMAALGLAGVPLAAAFAAIVLRVMSKLVSPDRTSLMVAGGTGFLLSVANTSMLTSLVTGGGIIFVLLVFLAPLNRD